MGLEVLFVWTLRLASRAAARLPSTPILAASSNSQNLQFKLKSQQNTYSYTQNLRNRLLEYIFLSWEDYPANCALQLRALSPDQCRCRYKQFCWVLHGSER